MIWLALLLPSRARTCNLTDGNRSTTVALSLDAATEGLASTGRPLRDFPSSGVEPRFLDVRLVRGRAEGMTSTPGLVIDYAWSLRKVPEHGRQRWREKLASIPCHAEAE